MTALDRLMSQIDYDTNGGCWLWNGAESAGYGSMHGAGESGAHRVAWAVFKKVPIPSGCVVMHRCDVSLCVNPNHLEIGTQTENLLDCYRRGRRSKKLSSDDHAAIRNARSVGRTYRSIADEFGVSGKMVWLVVRGMTSGRTLDRKAVSALSKRTVGNPPHMDPAQGRRASSSVAARLP